MTPDEIRLWQLVFLRKAKAGSGNSIDNCARWANEAVEAFRQANQREPEPNKGRL